MPPFTLATLGVDTGIDTLHRRRRGNDPSEPVGAASETPVPDMTHPAPVQPEQPEQSAQQLPSQPPSQPAASSRSTRHRVTSYYNAFQTTCSVSNDSPPTYAVASRSRPPVTIPEGSESLPSYSCTVRAEGKLLLSLESDRPILRPTQGEWREVFFVLRGTLLSFYRLKDGGPGKLLRSYSLQHAEVGLAIDSHHCVLVPQSRFANLIPRSARAKAYQKDPTLYKPIRQTLFRLRVETDQLLLAEDHEDRVHAMINAIGAAIDISHPIDERSIPKQCTVPRRRRRTRQQFTGDIMDPSVIAEQERIMQQMYPGFAGVVPTTEAQPAPETVETLSDVPSTPALEEEEIDFSAIREETAARPVADDGTARPSTTRQTTSSTMSSTFSDDMMYATADTNFSDSGKWQPPHHRSAAQVSRYVRRCMPLLLADSPRASDIVFSEGKRKKINWRLEYMEAWELQPPSYRSHKFDASTGIARSDSQRSSETTSQTSPGTSISGDQITPAAENLNLSKTVSTPDKAVRIDSPKRRSPEQLSREMQGVVFCF